MKKLGNVSLLENVVSWEAAKVILHIHKFVYKRIVANIFFFFFTAIVFSPSINEFTIYIYWLVPFFDVAFDLWAMEKLKTVKNNIIVAFLVVIIFFLLRLEFIMTCKIVTLMVSVMYLVYAYESRLFRYLYRWMNLNIIIAALQFVLFYTNKSILAYVTPTAIARSIWGNYATITNSNIYDIWGNGIVRTCGLSREAGFFASLLIVVWVCYCYDETIEQKKSQHILFIAGYFVSFSKMSLMLLPIAFLIKISPYLNKIFTTVCIFVWTLGMTMISCFLDYIGYFDLTRNISVANRLCGYCYIWRLDIKELIMGNGGELSNVSSWQFKNIKAISNLIYAGHSFCGIPQEILSFGLIGVVIFFGALISLGITPTGIVFLLCATINVDLLTSTSYVVLSYFAVLQLNRAF